MSSIALSPTPSSTVSNDRIIVPLTLRSYLYCHVLLHHFGGPTSEYLMTSHNIFRSSDAFQCFLSSENDRDDKWSRRLLPVRKRNTNRPQQAASVGRFVDWQIC